MIKHWFRKRYPPTHWYRAKRVRNRIITDSYISDKSIMDLINLERPALIGRIGASEAAAMSCIYDNKYKGSYPDFLSLIFSKITSKRRFRQLRDLAGVYPIDQKVLQEFYLEFFESIKNSDILGCWGEAFTSIEHLALENSNTLLIRQIATSPWVLDDLDTPGHWSLVLEGKRVLVISPFAYTFKQQLLRTHKIFVEAKYPSFEMIPMKAHLTQGGLDDGKTWTVHLSEMKVQMEEINFDIALISAGSYSNPLACHAKKIGKIGINCGGDLQLFFGVFGHRWKNPGRQHNYLNSSWVNPSINDRPKNWKTIEGGAYW
jgi:hypothetical protein